ncbi:aldo/keto reductase [Sporolactobacillus shoreicorticis]|uniref:Aldo/keto reductase n=1 Tax=Sporolactobacillus shoreicorticis TaxID=1923877 RepID=A0ABW5S046_9BACL|nr:aldo/keto reductase [Sporolactobacillus shoreicorticis]MCO7128159.1 aldo/keto reductase [Sporolactobacillus shoreicorticis]
MKKRSLGKSGIMVSRIGIGTAAWGFKLMGYGKSYQKEDLWDAYKTGLDNGVNFFDTADSYAGGDSERILGEFQKKDGREIMIASKHNPRNDKRPEDIMNALSGSLERLQVSSIDLYQLHFPPKDDQFERYAAVLAGAYAQGLVKAVGVSNFNLERTARFHDCLLKYDLPLSSNQVYYHLLERRVEDSGLIDYCEKENIAVIPLSPMAQGVLTGKYALQAKKLSVTQKVYFWIQQLDLFHDEKEKKPLLRKIFTRPEAVKIKKYLPLFELMDRIAARHQTSIAQIALSWLLFSSDQMIPIPGVKNKKQAQSNLMMLSVDLTQKEFNELSQMEEVLANE